MNCVCRIHSALIFWANDSCFSRSVQSTCKVRVCSGCRARRGHRANSRTVAPYCSSRPLACSSRASPRCGRSLSLPAPRTLWRSRPLRRSTIRRALWCSGRTRTFRNTRELSRITASGTEEAAFLTASANTASSGAARTRVASPGPPLFSYGPTVHTIFEKKSKLKICRL